MSELMFDVIILEAITLMSGFVAYEFYRSVNGRLRVLMIQLFCAKVFLYGVSGVIILIGYDINATIRLILNIPMCYVMIRLWGYIRTHKK